MGDGAVQSWCIGPFRGSGIGGLRHYLERAATVGPPPIQSGSTLVAALAYAAVALSLAGTAMALRAGYSLRRPWQWPLGGSPSVYWNYIALGMLGDLILTMYHTGKLIGAFAGAHCLRHDLFSVRQSAALRQLYDAIVLDAGR